jgi:hypothetical protein
MRSFFYKNKTKQRIEMKKIFKKNTITEDEEDFKSSSSARASFNSRWRAEMLKVFVVEGEEFMEEEEEAWFIDSIEVFLTAAVLSEGATGEEIAPIDALAANKPVEELGNTQRSRYLWMKESGTKANWALKSKAESIGWKVGTKLIRNLSIFLDSVNIVTRIN